MIYYDSLSVSRSKVFLLIIIQSQPCIDVDNHLRSFQRQRQTEIQTADEDVSSLNLTRFQKEGLVCHNESEHDIWGILTLSWEQQYAM